MASRFQKETEKKSSFQTIYEKHFTHKEIWNIPDYGILTQEGDGYIVPTQ